MNLMLDFAGRACSSDLVGPNRVCVCVVVVGEAVT